MSMLCSSGVFLKDHRCMYAFVSGAPLFQRRQGCGLSKEILPPLRTGQAPGAVRCLPKQTTFTGRQLSLGFERTALSKAAPGRRRAVKMIVDPWSVSPAAIDALAAQLFAASLAPYLGFLYFLGREEVNCPKLANFGFRFLLVFVFATIPAGIYAKVHYHDILANIDWLHGGAESLLTITNSLIALGFQAANKPPPMPSSATDKPGKTEGAPLQLKSFALPLLSLSALIPLATATGSALHVEPANALSFPTWIIHVSSLIEWWTAMGLVWKYADISGKPGWKGLTWGMLPLHASGICACTYHFFYNAPPLNGLVALQAGLTCVGNASMAFATYRIFRAGRNAASPNSVDSDSARDRNIPSPEFPEVNFGAGSNVNFLAKVLVASAVGAATIKWGSLFIDAPFKASLSLALSIICAPTLVNASQWAMRSRAETVEKQQSQ